MTSRTSGSLYFGVDARHIRQLGRELVADKVTALAELIKNAYDADATEVVLTFVRADRIGGTLEVVDNGSGMSLADIERRWMRISTDAKERETRSTRFNRVRAGRKGIGRFAAESLGSRLVLRTKFRGATERVVMTFAWNEDFPAGRELSEVANAYVLEPAPPEEHGTTLAIEALHDAWSDAALERVQRAVLLLQPPFPVSPDSAVPQADPGFRVVVRTRPPREQAAERPALRDFFSSATAEIAGTVDGGGNAAWSIKGERFKLDASRPLDRRVLSTGSLTFRAHYFIYRRDMLGSIAVRQAQDMANRYGGIRIYRDGMRIPPYGDAGNDWLELDALSRRRTILIPLANSNFFGVVSISRDENVLLVDTASREGVVENEAFDDLRTFVRDGLIWGAQQVAAARPKKKRKGRVAADAPQSREALVENAFENVLAAASSKGQTLGPEIVSVLREAIASAHDADAAEREIRNELLGEIELLRVLAALGTSIALFSHEVRGAVNRATGALSDIAELDTHGKNGDHTELLEEARDAIEQLAALGAFIDLYMSQTRRRERRPQPVHDVVRQFVDAFGRTFHRRNIAITWKVEPASLRTAPMTRSELDAILFNFLTNAVKAMDYEGHIERRIQIEGRRENKSAVIRFEDTGVGIDPNVADRLFDPFVTTSQPGDSELGIGTGLGLKIVADIAEAYEGAVAVAPPSDGFRTCFVLTLPRWEGE
jgi:signal transduction histidine kinase